MSTRATWLIADLHFGHEGIIRMCSRPFADVREMNQTMADAWRRAVKPGDDIIVVGDFAHRMPVDELKKLFASLPGTKHLVLGNHDVNRRPILALTHF